MLWDKEVGPLTKTSGQRFLMKIEGQHRDVAGDQS